MLQRLRKSDTGFFVTWLVACAWVWLTFASALGLGHRHTHAACSSDPSKTVITAPHSASSCPVCDWTAALHTAQTASPPALLLASPPMPEYRLQTSSLWQIPVAETPSRAPPCSLS